MKPCTDSLPRLTALLVVSLTSAHFLVGSAGAAQLAVLTAPVADSLNRAAASQSLELEKLTGEYEMAPGRTVTITLEKGVLHAQPSGGDKRTISHVSGTTFSVFGTPMTLTFTLDDQGHATTVVMRQNDRERILLRIR